MSEKSELVAVAKEIAGGALQGPSRGGGGGKDEQMDPEVRKRLEALKGAGPGLGAGTGAGAAAGPGPPAAPAAAAVKRPPPAFVMTLPAHNPKTDKRQGLTLVHFSSQPAPSLPLCD
jgi:hypothetical protein